jgi:hypothetical protein
MSLFQSEKSKFKQDLMLTLPNVKTKEIVKLSPKNNSTIKEPKSEPRNEPMRTELSGSGSGTVTSSEDFDNQYDFGEIFDD